MITTKEGKKRGIKYGPNVEQIVREAREHWEKNTIEGRATQHERDMAKVIENPRAYRIGSPKLDPLFKRKNK